MTDINEELRTLLKNTVIYDIQIANAIEEVTGVAVGTRENLLLVKEQLEERIEEIKNALELLDNVKHYYAKYTLENILNNLVYPTLAKVNKRLEEGVY